MLNFISSKERANLLSSILDDTEVPIVETFPRNADTTLNEMLRNDFSIFDFVVVDMRVWVGYEEADNVMSALEEFMACNKEEKLILYWIGGRDEVWRDWLRQRKVLMIDNEDHQREDILAILDGGEPRYSGTYDDESDTSIEDSPVAAQKGKRGKRKPKSRKKSSEAEFPHRQENIIVNVFGSYPHIGVTYTAISLFLFLCKQGASVLLVLPKINLSALGEDVYGLSVDERYATYRSGSIVNSIEDAGYDNYDFVIYDRGGVTALKPYRGNVNILMAGLKSWELPYVRTFRKIYKNVENIDLVFSTEDKKKEKLLKKEFGDFNSVSFMRSRTRLSEGTPNGNLFFNILSPEFMTVMGQKRDSIFDIMRKGLRKK